MTASPDTVSLDGLGNVPADYRHEWRVGEPHEPIVVPSGIFKWYHVRREGEYVPDELDAEARAIVVEAARAGWDLQYGLNFALLHVSTTHAFLIIGIWRGHQELWERIYGRELGPAGSFSRIEPGPDDGPAACVWEMGVICHERMAWHRYLFSERGEEDKRAWLADTCTGRV